MSDTQQLLERLRRMDVRLTLEGERLDVNAPRGVLTDALRAELAARKEEIKACLRAGSRDAGADDAPIARVPRAAAMPLSHTQQRIWFIKQIDPGTHAYNVPGAFRFKGPLDAAALESALNDAVARHEVLRTRFLAADGVPYCTVEPAARVSLEHFDVSGSSPAHRLDAALRKVDAAARRPFDLSVAPLLRVVLVRLDAGDHILALVFDHMICDGVSVGVFLEELAQGYARHATGTGAPPVEPAVQYLDYVEWERKAFARGTLDEHRRFWKEELAGLPAVLQLPTDRPRPPMQSSAGARVAARLDAKLGERLRELARGEGATLFMVLLAAFQALLSRYSGATDFAVGTAIVNRDRPEVERTMGFFANNIVLRADLSGRPTVREAIARVRQRAIRAYAHQAMPFDMLVDELAPRRDLSLSPIFQVLFVLQQQFLKRYDLAEIEGEAIELPSSSARLDLAVDVFDLREGPIAYFEYNTDLFEAATIERMAGHYARLLEGFAASPGARVDELVLLGAQERERILVEWNRTDAVHPQRATLHALFESQVARTPDAVAVRFEDERLAYGELNARANRLARHLRSLGVGKESLVGIRMERSAQMVVALLGILKAGGAYVPLDPAFPEDRLAFMVEDAGLAVIVDEALLASVPAGLGDGNLEPLSGPENLAYVIYTSGSTGRPKGVELEHRSVANFVRSMHREPGIGAGDRVVAVTTLSFDIAGLEIHGPLTCGGTVVIASRETTLDGKALAGLLDRSEATLLQATPATWRLLLESGWSGRKAMKMLCGGEALPRELAARLLQLGGELWNLYGPTETTIWSTLARITDAAREIPIGRPIANTQVYVLEPSGQPAPIGVGGELCIGGDGLARGYRDRPELTAGKFVTLDLPGVGSRRVYRTGDVARFLPNGELEYLGRRDNQVKVRGFRIELGEIEAVLAAHASVRQCVVVAREAGAGDARLVAYVVYKPGEEATVSDIRRFLRRQLPEYMVPSVVVALDLIPLTPNGKLDRAHLPDPFRNAQAAAADEPPADGMEARIAAIWRDLLKVERVGAHDNFFELGGHSLLALRVANAVEKETGLRIDPRAMFFQSLRQLAAQPESRT